MSGPTTRGSIDADAVNALIEMAKELADSNRLLQAQLDSAEGRLGREQTPGGTPLVHEAKTADPDKYDGKDPHGLGRFLTQCFLTFEARPNAFASDGAKIKWMTTFLRGIAFDSVQALMNVGECDELKSYRAFVQYLKDSFGDPDEKGTASRKLRELRQTGTAAEYFVKVRELIAVLGWKDEEPILDRAIGGLNDELQDEIARSGKDFEKFTDLVKFIVPLDNRIRAREAEKKKTQPRHHVERIFSATPTTKTFSEKVATPSQTQTTQTTTSVQPNAALVDQTQYTQYRGGPLSEEERTRRRVHNLCNYCGQAGHYSIFCPKRQAKLSDGVQNSAPTQARPPSPAPRAPSPSSAPPKA